MELTKLKADADSLSQMLFASPELAEFPNGPQIAVCIDGLLSELLRVIGQLQQDVEAANRPRS